MTYENKIVAVEEIKIDDIINLETAQISVKTKVLEVTTY